MDSSKKKIIFIKGDLNSLQQGIIPLRNQIWLKVIEKHYGPIQDGLKIWLYENTERDGKIDPTVFPGIIRETGIEDEYEIHVDEKDMKYLFESKEIQQD